MARKKKSELEAEAAAASKHKDKDSPVDDTPDVTVVDETMGAVVVDQAPVKPRKSRPKQTDVPRPTAEELAAAAPKRYEVIRGGRIMHRGALTQMRTGKVFKANDYNVPQLRQQGIELKEV